VRKITRKGRPSLAFLLGFLVAAYKHKRYKAHGSMRRTIVVHISVAVEELPSQKQIMRTIASHTVVQAQDTNENAEDESKCNRYITGIMGERPSLSNCSKPPFEFFSIVSCFSAVMLFETTQTMKLSHP
jgi:hypothetical protein